MSPRLLSSFALPCIVALLLLGVPSWPVKAQATPEPAADGLQYTPVIQSVPATPRWFTGSDGQAHLVYELLLTNAFAVPVTISAVEVLDAETNATVTRLDGDALLAATSLMSAPTEPTVTLAPSTIGVVWFDISLAGVDELPAAIEHRLTVAMPPGLPVPESITSTGAEATVDTRPPVVLGAPLAGPRWAAIGSCCDGPHRRSLQPIDGGL